MPRRRSTRLGLLDSSVEEPKTGSSPNRLSTVWMSNTSCGGGAKTSNWDNNNNQNYLGMLTKVNQRIDRQNTNVPSLNIPITYLLDISRCSKDDWEQAYRNAEQVMNTGIIYAIFPGVFAYTNARHIHCGLDVWIDEHCRKLGKENLTQQVRSMMADQAEHVAPRGGLWKWNGQTFTPIPDLVAMNRLIQRLRDAKRSGYDRKPRKGLRPMIQSFQILNQRTPYVQEQEQQPQPPQQHDTGRVIIRHPSNILPDNKSRMGHQANEDDLETNKNYGDKEMDNAEDAAAAAADDDDDHSAVSSITTPSWLGRHTQLEGSLLPPPPLLPAEIDCHDPEAVFRQAEINCLRVVCQNLRERVRYLELQHQQRHHNTPLSSSWLCITDEEFVEHCMMQLQFPEYLRNNSFSVPYATAAVPTTARRTIRREEEQMKETTESLPRELSNHDDDNTDSPPLLGLLRDDSMIWSMNG